MKNFTKSLMLAGVAISLVATNAIAQFGCGSAVVIADGFTATGIITPGTGGAEDWNTNPTGTSINTNYWDDDVYLFEYTAGATAEQISMTIFTRNSWNGIGIFDDCTGTTFSNELDADGSSAVSVSRTVTATISAGNTVYIAVGQWGTPNDLDFDVTDFTVTPIACADPSAGTATNVTSTTADIGWTENGTATTWNIEWGVSGFIPTGTPTISGTTNNPEPLSGLTPDTDYEFYVQADCGGSGTSNWAGPFSFSTPCAVVTPTYLTDFSTFLPACWEEADNGDEITGPTGLGTGSWGQNGSLARINLFTTGKSDWLLTPEFDLSAGGWELVVEASGQDFGASAGTFSGMGSDDSVQVLISTDGGTTWTNLFTFDAANPPAANATDYIIDLSAYTGTSNLFGILATEGAVNDPEDYYPQIHSFEIRQPLSCLEPSSILVSNILETTADINWTAGNVSQLEWVVTVVPSGSTPLMSTASTSFTNAFNATGLTAATDYDVYVREVCAPGDTTAWVGPVTFTTACGTVVGDDAATPLVLSGLNPTATGTTANCYTDLNAGPGFGHAAPDVWYEYTLDPCASDLVVSLCGSGFDTYLAIYAADGTTLISDNDDNFPECGAGNNSHLEIDIAATAGISGGDLIYIVVDGFGSSSGSYNLNVNTILGSPVVTTTVSGSEVTADATGVSYQWLDCDNGNAIIPGATDQTFVAPVSGNFAVEIDENGCVDTSACEALSVSLPADLVITEINYNGPEAGTDSTEFVEIFNNGATDVNLLGYTFVQGFFHQINENLILPAGGYVVFAFDSAAIANVYGHTGAVEWTSGGLSNSGEDITLEDPLGNTVDSVNYDDAAPWPVSADGNGPSLVICDVSQDNNDGTNWFASSTDVGLNINGSDIFGSPGAANICITQCPSAFSITACDSYTVPSGDETYTTSGVYLDTITGTAGCDSIMTITVTINTSNTGIDTQVACGSYTWIDGITYTASNTTATFTETNAAGCDSVVTLNLTINQPTTGTDVITECDSLTWIDGVTYYASTNTPTFTIVGGNSNGCDSTVTLDLTIIPNAAPVPDAATLPDATDECSVTLTAPTATDDCSGTITGTPDVTFPITAQGTTVVTWTFDDGAGLTTTQTQNVIIDDVTPPTASNPVTLNVQCAADVPPATPSFVTDEADNCGTPVVAFVSEVSDGQTCPETLTRTFSVTDAGGNAITVTQTIIINDDVVPVLDVPALADVVGFCDLTPATPTATDNCSGTIDGVADVTFPINTVGTTVVTWTYTDDCGNSTTQTQNVVVEQINVNTFFASDGITIVSSNNDAGVTFQWIDCNDNNQPLAGETNQNFTPTYSSDFAVIVTQDGCSDTSACVTITEVGIGENELNSVHVYPNPVKDFVKVDLGSITNATVQLIDVNGKVLFTEERINDVVYTFEMNQAPGVYFIEVQSNELVKRFKVVKEQ